jgi:hypothetical protein
MSAAAEGSGHRCFEFALRVGELSLIVGAAIGHELSHSAASIAAS